MTGNVGYLLTTV